jgi:putative membrane protein
VTRPSTSDPLTEPAAPHTPATHDTPIDPTVAEAQWHRVNARTILVRPFNEALGLIPALVGVIALGQHDSHIYWALGAIALLLLRGLLHWLTTRYRITDEQVELRTGLLFRQRFAAKRDRVRTVESTARFGHRLFGVTAVRVGTGQHEDKRHKPLMLDAVTTAEADQLRRMLLRRAPARQPGAQDTSTASEPAPAPGERIAALDWGWLRYAPLTLSGLAAIGVLAGLVWRSFNELDINVSRFQLAREGLHWAERTSLVMVILIGALIGLLVVLFGSVLVYTFKFAGYTLTREADDTLHIRRGLLTTSAVTIEEARMRGVEVSEPLLLRLAKGAQCNAVVVGMRHKSGNHMLMPPGPGAEVNRVAAAALRAERTPTLTALVGHSAKALRRRLVRSIGPVVVLTLALWLLSVPGWWPAWLWQASLVLLPFAALLGWDRYRSLGHALTDQYLVTRLGALDRRTVALQRTGIIGWRIKRSFFQRRAGLLTLTATTAAGRGGYAVLDLDVTDGLALADAAVPGVLAPFVQRGPAHAEAVATAG